jgi:hypothetical protein
MNKVDWFRKLYGIFLGGLSQERAATTGWWSSWGRQDGIGRRKKSRGGPSDDAGDLEFDGEGAGQPRGGPTAEAAAVNLDSRISGSRSRPARTRGSTVVPSRGAQGLGVVEWRPRVTG